MTYTVRMTCPFFNLVSRKATPEDAFKKASRLARDNDNDVPSRVTIETPDGHVLDEANFRRVFQVNTLRRDVGGV